MEIMFYVGSNMPRWVKKFRNTMGNGRTRFFCFNGCDSMMKRLYVIHKRIKDFVVNTRAAVSVYKLREEHFELNSDNKTIFLAMHVLSKQWQE